MKNILLISTIYPLPNTDNQGTPICHYFAREWIKMGYNVKVIHLQTIYPFFLYWLAKLFRNIIASKTGAVVYTKREKDDTYFNLECVSVYRLPIYKSIPHGKFSHSVIQLILKKIIRICSIDDFIPDLVLGHFPNPQIEIVSNLKKSYPKAITSVILHGNIDSIKKIYKNTYLHLMKDIDCWGFRSMPIKETFEGIFGRTYNSFICYSGIPATYITTNNNHDFSSILKNFVYVGELIQRKFPIALIKSIPYVYSNSDFRITYIGNGAERKSIEKEIKRLNISKNITFIGKIPREMIFQYFDNSDCMIMISKDEAFGLVYLEAMARGCITIGSKKEGIDGVIKHGINGFLCEAGNSDELIEVIKYINNLTSDEKRVISQNAIATASKLTDYNAAEKYINSVLNFKSHQYFEY